MTHAEPSRPRRKTLGGLAVALIVGALLASVFFTGSDLLESGTRAPPFELNAVESGRAVSLERLRGRVVLLDFWSTSCPPCLRQIPDLETLREQIDQGDLEILGINAGGDPPEVVRDFARARRIRYQLFADPGQVSRAYRVERLPTLYIIDRIGDVRWSREGYTPAEELSRIVRELL